MDIILPENTVQASSDEPRVKNQRAETAAAVSCGADGVENAGVDKKALPLREGKAVRSGTCLLYTSLKMRYPIRKK